VIPARLYTAHSTQKDKNDPAFPNTLYPKPPHSSMEAMPVMQLQPRGQTRYTPPTYTQYSAHELLVSHTRTRSSLTLDLTG